MTEGVESFGDNALAKARERSDREFMAQVLGPWNPSAAFDIPIPPVVTASRGDEVIDGEVISVKDSVDGTPDGTTVDHPLITLPAGDDGDEVQISGRAIYDALAQLSFTLCNGDGWSIDMPAIAWQRLADGIDPYESFIYSTYEEVLVDLYVVAALCVPHGWWPVEADDPIGGGRPVLEAWTIDEWNDFQGENGYATIGDPAAALAGLAELIRSNPRSIMAYERKRTAGLLPAGITAPTDVDE